MKYFSFITLFTLSACFSNGDATGQEKALMLKADECAKKQMWDSAIYYSQKAFDLNDSSLYLSNIGAFYLRKNMPEKAIKYLDSASKLDPNNLIIHHNLGNVYESTKDLILAIKEYEKILSLKPTDYDSKIALSKLYFDISQYELSIKYLNQMIEKEPDKKVYKYYRGRANSYLGKSDDALKDFDEIIKIDPLNGNYLYARGMAYAGLFKTDLAIADLKKVISINPNNPPVANVYYNLAYLYLTDKKDKTKACVYIHLDAKVHSKEVSGEDLKKFCNEK